jgi:hypothetical protein
MNIVIEYIVDTYNCIKGWILHPQHKRPDLIDNPLPTEKMNKLKDNFGNDKFKLENNKIIFLNPTPTISQIYEEAFNKNFNLLKVSKLLIKGIHNENDTEFKDLEDILSYIRE